MFRRTLLASVGAIAFTGSAAFAADLLSRAPPPVYLPPPPIFTWTGFYAGLNAGYTFGGSNSVDVDTVPAFANVATFGAVATALGNAVAASANADPSLHNSGFIGGGQIGYNLQFANSWLVGIEADMQGTGARTSATAIGVAPLNPTVFIPGTASRSTISINNAVDWLGTVRGRIGFLWTPSLLIYGDGGFAYGGVHQDVDVADVTTNGLGASPAFGSFSNTRTGWTAGGGLEWMFAPNWSAKLEYLYYDLGRTTFNVGALTLPVFNGIATFNVFTDPVLASTRWNGHIVRVGLNYHFNWGYPAPVVAKY